MADRRPLGISIDPTHHGVPRDDPADPPPDRGSTGEADQGRGNPDPEAEDPPPEDRLSVGGQHPEPAAQREEGGVHEHREDRHRPGRRTQDRPPESEQPVTNGRDLRKGPEAHQDRCQRPGEAEPHRRDQAPPRGSLRGTGRIGWTGRRGQGCPPRGRGGITAHPPTRARGRGLQGRPGRPGRCLPRPWNPAWTARSTSVTATR